MKIKLIQLLLAFSLLACKSESYSNYDEMLIKTVQKQITKKLKWDEELVFIKIISKDTLTMAQESDALLRYSNYNLTRLNKIQRKLTGELELAKDKKDLEKFKIEYERLDDSVKYYSQIGTKATYTIANTLPSGNYRVILVSEVINTTTNEIKNDSLFIYVDDKKIIFTEAQFVKLSIAKLK